MSQFLNEIETHIAEGNIDSALGQLRSILSLGESELLSDVIILSARHKKLRSDVRKGIINYNQESMQFNRISHSVLELLQDIKNSPEDHVKGFGDINAELEDANQTRKDIKVEIGDIDKIEANLSMATQIKKHIYLDEEVKQALYARMAFIKEKQQSFRALWVDDFLDSIQHEVAVLKVMGIHFDYARSSQEALALIHKHSYHVIISDIVREGKQEGLDFLKEFMLAGYDIPLIFYIAALQPEKGVPPFAFGIAEYPSDLIHLVCDVLERG